MFKPPTGPQEYYEAGLRAVRQFCLNHDVVFKPYDSGLFLQKWIKGECHPWEPGTPEPQAISNITTGVDQRGGVIFCVMTDKGYDSDLTRELVTLYRHEVAAVAAQYN